VPPKSAEIGILMDNSPIWEDLLLPCVDRLLYLEFAS